MKREFEIEKLPVFQRQYRENEDNSNIEKNIKKWGLRKSCLAEPVKPKMDFKFNIEVPDVKIYNQNGSRQCNIYAFLRVVKDVLRKNADLDIDGLDLSANYINFFDKLEKINVVYNVIIESRKITFSTIKNTVDRYIGSFGTFHFCREIINKYGLVPSSAMPELDTNYDDSLTIELLKNKVKTDALYLLKLPKKRRLQKKDELMFEAYTFLSKVYGNPPMEFDFKKEHFTPLEFKNRYLKDNLKDYVTVTPFDKSIFQESYSFVPSIYLNSDEKIIYIPIEKIKNAIIEQLKDGISIWFSLEESTTFDLAQNILTDDMYDFKNTLNIRLIPKNQKMHLDMINYDHAMCITGALVKDEKIIQLKVDNSFGEGGDFKGHLIMTTSFLENDCITFILDKKYLKTYSPK